MKGVFAGLKINMTMEAVTFKNVSEKYGIKFVLEGKESWEDFWALKGISFSVEKGQALALIGENGAGKSTILKLITGSIKTDKGQVLVRGKVSALLELGAGFHPEYTGRENIYLNASLFGLGKNDTDNIFSKIAEFSGLGRFIDAQVKSYSQGMFVRLAFSVAIFMDPDILLIDDALAVGDEDFQKKCLQKILELKNEGKTIIFVTHDLNMARRICAKGIFLRSGEIIKEGPIDSVISYYMETLGNREGIAIIQKGALGMVFNNGRFIIRWQDKTITQDHGGYSSFLFEGHRFNSSTANWRLENNDEKQIIAKGEWFNIPVVQIWDIKLLDDGLLEFKVTLKRRDKSSIRNFHVEVLFTKEYNQWLSSEHKGVFPENFFHERECELIYNDTFDKLACLKQNYKEEGPESLPTVIVDAFGQEKEVSCQILNSGLDITARIIRLNSQAVYQAIENSIETRLSLSMKIKFIGFEQKDVLEGYLNSFRHLIRQERQRFEKKKLELRFKKFMFGNSLFSLCIDENNLLQLYYADKKLTSDPGIVTSLRMGKVWKDTYGKQMRIEQPAPGHIKVYDIAWLDVPAIQTWSFLMKEEGVIEVSMQMDVESQISIHEIHVSIPVSQSYTKWITSYEAGNFRDELKAGEEIYLKDKNIKAIGVVSDFLPAIVLDLSGNSKYLPRICNSTGVFAFPVIQAVAEGMKYEKGKIEFFNGIIRVSAGDIKINAQSGLLCDVKQEIEEDIFDKEDSDLYFLDGQEIGINDAQLCIEDPNRLAEMQKMYREGKIGIAVSRFNFFKLGELLKFYSGIFNRKVDLDGLEFNIFPVRTIFINFIEYCKRIKSAAQDLGMRLVLKDKDLPYILKIISAQETAYHGKHLLRLLGVICEHAFVGPRQIVIDLYHRCNSGCLHCWFHNPKTTLPDEYLDMRLDFDLFKKIADDAEQLSVELIIFEGNGEPLLDQRFAKMVAYAKDKGIMISFSTNGILFDQEMSKKTLFDFDVETITCSLPAATEETYALINPKQTGSAFHEIVRNLSYFIKIRNNSGLKKPYLKMNHVIHALNCHELMKMAELDAQIGADIVQFCIIQKPDKNIIHLQLTCEQLDFVKDSLPKIEDFLNQRNIILDDGFLFQLKRYGDNIVTPQENVGVNRGCPIGWFQVLIFANSEVSMCQLKVVGSLNNASLKEIWDSQKYHRYRIQAKYLKDNKEIVFENGEKLYDENCRRCDIVRGALKIDGFYCRDLDKFV